EQHVVATLRQLVRRKANWRPDVALQDAGAVRDPEVGWRNTDDRRRLAIDIDRAADDRRVRAEVRAPERIAQYGRQRRVKAIIVGRDPATALRRRTEHPKEAAGDEHLRRLDRLAADVDER